MRGAELARDRGGFGSPKGAAIRSSGSGSSRPDPARAGPALCRRRSRRAVRQRRRRRAAGGRSSRSPNHPTRAKWFPGAGGLMVHSIGVRSVAALAADRRRLGGRRLPFRRRRRRRGRRRNAGVRADFLPDKIPRGGAVRAPHGDAPAAAGRAVSAESLRRLSQRRRRRYVERHLGWPAIAFRLSVRRAAARRRYRLRHPRRERPGADDAERDASVSSAAAIAARPGSG